MNLTKTIGIFLLLGFQFLGFTGRGQILNVESLRKVSDSSRWSGNVNLDVSLIKNKSNIFRISAGSHIQYKNGGHLVLFVNDLNFQQLDTSRFINKGTQHLRYNYKLRPRIAWEAFAQGQFDAVSNIDFRGLLGTGPRFKLTTADKYRFYLGTLVMYEYEKISETVARNIRRDVRGSIYLSFSLYPSDQLSVVSTTYYQPKLDSWGDYRISNENSIAFQLYKGLGFKSGFVLSLDTFPAPGVPDLQYEWTNGLVYSFD